MPLPSGRTQLAFIPEGVKINQLVYQEFIHEQVLKPLGINTNCVRPLAVAPAHTMTKAGFLVLDTLKVDLSKVLLSVDNILRFFLVNDVLNCENFLIKEKDFIVSAMGET